jgi:nitroreductase
MDLMDFQEVVDKRRMTRNYLPDPVDPGIITLAIRNATRAPSAGFSQGWDFLVLDQPDTVRAYWEATTTDLTNPDTWLRGMMQAPVLIIPCSDKSAYLDRYALSDKGWTDREESRWPMPFWHLDTAMASLLILQTATDHGLGSCFFGIPPEHVDSVRSTFSIPAKNDPIGAITIGHRAPRRGAAGSPTRRTRRQLEDVIKRNEWS